MRRGLLSLLGLPLLANGLFMLLAPLTWYGLVPGVSDTGPFNPHFVRDIGAAYAVAAGGLLALVRYAAAWPAAIAGSVFLLLHAGVHIVDALQGRIAPAHLLNDALLVLLPALLALALAWPRAASVPTRH
jgi:hypothetical protein